MKLTPIKTALTSIMKTYGVDCFCQTTVWQDSYEHISILNE